MMGLLSKRGTAYSSAMVEISEDWVGMAMSNMTDTSSVILRQQREQEKGRAHVPGE